MWKQSYNDIDSGSGIPSKISFVKESSKYLLNINYMSSPVPGINITSGDFQNLI
jgi:hypothetical protein